MDCGVALFRSIQSRFQANNIIQDVNDGLDLEQRLQKFDGSARDGDSSRLIVWAGVGVGLTDKISSAAEIVNDLCSDMFKALDRAKSLIK